MADLAARESGDKTEGTFCARCFAHVASGEAYCPECGAPTGAGAPTADTAVHAELAQANLLRLRGDLDASEKALLGILRRFPNDPHAHEMLGDVCAERGERDRAIEWYELALDLAPDSTDLRRKLQTATTEVDAQETADTAQVLGLPPSTPPAVWWPLTAAAALLVLAIAVAAWPRTPTPTPLRTTVAAPLVEAPINSITEPVVPKVETPPVTPTPAPVTGAEEDRRLLTDLKARPGGDRVQSVQLDPRTQAVVVTFDVVEAEDPRTTALSLGREVLSAAPAALTVTLRGVRAGSLAFAADLTRANLTAADPLTNVWPTTTEGEAATPPPVTDPPATTGTAPPTTTGEATTTGTPGP